VATPIGNLQDITYRAVQTLKDADYILAEDTRVTGKLLARYEIDTKMKRYHKFNMKRQNSDVLSLLDSGLHLALVSDAGTPGISDPGQELVALAVQGGHRVEPIPGACALVVALVASGLPTTGFRFVGFCTKLDKSLLEVDVPLIFYEAPHRIQKFLAKLLAFFGERKVVIARELTKLHESFYRGMLSEFVDNPDEPKIKGEFVVILDGAPQKEAVSDELALQTLREKVADGLSCKEAIKQVCQELSLKKNKVYALSLQIKK